MDIERVRGHENDCVGTFCLTSMQRGDAECKRVVGKLVSFRAEASDLSPAEHLQVVTRVQQRDTSGVHNTNDRFLFRFSVNEHVQEVGFAIHKDCLNKEM